MSKTGRERKSDGTGGPTSRLAVTAHRTSVPDVAGVVVVEAVEEGGRVVVLARPHSGNGSTLGAGEQSWSRPRSEALFRGR